jgi:hypothetical protein
MFEPDLRYKVTWNGREWLTRSHVDAQILMGLLQQSWPNSAPQLWEQVPAGFYDEEQGINVDGFMWQLMAWNGKVE